MICPNCSVTTNDDRICYNCGIDKVLFKCAVDLSNIYYNKALNFAKHRELTAAVEILNKALELNKNHIQARNLLGLVYYELGVVSEAIKHWVISRSIFRDDDTADRYIRRFQDNTQQFEQYEDAIREYNNALNYARQRNEDMAMIQLKRAIGHNPRFVDALNLYALLLILKNDKEKAASRIQRVLEIDKRNPTALYYSHLIKKVPRPKTEKRPEKVRAVPVRSPGFGFTDIISFIIGVLVTYAFVSYLILPSKLETRDDQIKLLEDNSKTLQEKYDKDVNDLQTNLTKAINTADTLQVELDEKNELLDLQGKAQRVYSVNNLYLLGKVDEAADILSGMDVDDLPDEVKTLAVTLKSEALAKSSKDNFDKGKSLFNSKKYIDAEPFLQKSLLYADMTLDYVDDIYYYLGIIFENTAQPEKALECYKILKEQYPKSNFITQANNRLKALGQ